MHTSFELVYTIVDGLIVIDIAYLVSKRDQVLQVFPTYEIMGWYISGRELGDYLQNPQKTMLKYNESPLLLLVDCEPSSVVRDLPAFIYETSVHIGDERTLFTKIPYRIESEESERISVDHITHLQSTGMEDSSSLVKQLGGMHDAVWMLQQRIKVIQAYLEGARRGDHPVDLNLLRHVKALCNKLPAIDSDKFNESFLTSYQDSLLIAYLGMLTKGCNAMNEVVDKYNVLNERSRGRRYPM